MSNPPGRRAFTRVPCTQHQMRWAQICAMGGVGPGTSIPDAQSTGIFCRSGVPKRRAWHRSDVHIVWLETPLLSRRVSFRVLQVQVASEFRNQLNRFQAGPLFCVPSLLLTQHPVLIALLALWFTTILPPENSAISGQLPQAVISLFVFAFRGPTPGVPTAAP